MASFTVAAGTTDTTERSLSGGQTGTIAATGTLSNPKNDGNPSITWTGGAGTTTVTNAGSIAASGTGDRGIDSNKTLAAGSSLSVVNESGATIVANDDAIRIRATISGGSVNIDNRGAIVSGTYTDGVISGTSSGQALDLAGLTSDTPVTITNEAGALIGTASADAIRTAANTTINNYGRIVAQAYNGDTGNDAIDFQSAGTGTINNFAGGSITGARDGITGKLPITVNNAGTITGQLGSGLNMDTGGTTVTTINNQAGGVIIGTAAGSSDGDGVDVDGLVSLDNAGTIQAVGTWDGGLNEAITVGGGTIVNEAGGLITSVQRAITVDNSDLGGAYAATTVTNLGTIKGGNGEAISITGTFDDTVTNQGTITGSVTLGGGNDTFNAETGSTTSGAIDGGDGIDAVVLVGTGAGTLSGAVNFETLAVNGGTWSVTDSEGYANGTTIAAGATLQFGTGGTDGSVSGSILDNGTLTVDRSDAVSLTGVSGSGTVVQSGTGTLTLSAGNSYTGGTAIAGGTLEIAASDAAGTGAVSFAAGTTGWLLLDAGVSLTNSIAGFAAGDTIDFAGVAYNASESAVYSADTGVLSIVDTASGATLASLTLSTSLDGTVLGLSDDGQGGLALTSQAYAPASYAAGDIATFGSDQLYLAKVDHLANGQYTGTTYDYRTATGAPFQGFGDAGGNEAFFIDGSQGLEPIVGSGTVNFIGTQNAFGTGDVLVDLAGGTVSRGGTQDATLQNIQGVQLGAANSTVLGLTTGTDLIYGGAGAMTFQGGGATDYISGGSGNATIIGGAGNEIFYSGGGTNTMTGGSAANFLSAGTASASNDTFTGTGGYDFIYAHGGTVTLNGGSGQEVLAGSSGTNVLNGATTADANGSSGFNIFNGGTGADAGNDTFHGGIGTNLFNEGDGTSVFNGTSGTDYIYGGAGTSSVFAGSGTDVVTTGAGNQYVQAGTGSLFFNDTADNLTAGRFDQIDNFTGAKSADLYLPMAVQGATTFTEQNGGTAIVTAVGSGSATLFVSGASTDLVQAHTHFTL